MPSKTILTDYFEYAPYFRISYFPFSLLVVTSLLFLSFPFVVAAHTDLTDRIDVLSHKIKHNPDSLKLYMERGKIYHLRGQYQKALKDFQLAEKLDPKNVEVRFEQGLVLLKLGRSKQALAMFNHVLKSDPMYQAALMNRARVFRSIGDYENAAIDYTRVLNGGIALKPEDYIEIANNYVEYGQSHYGQALLVLDLALNKLGVLVQLQSRAIDIDLLTKNYQSALQRIDILLTTMHRKEKWLVKKADILLLLGKPTEAQENYRMALLSIKKLPAARRNVKAIKNLEAYISKILLDLTSGKLRKE